MTHDELQQRFRCGSIEASYENSKLFSVFMQLIFTAVGMYFLWLMLNEGTFVERLDNIAVLVFCLWRIHRQRDIICYVAEKGLIVRRQFMSFQEFYNEQVHEEKNLVFLPYKEIFSISDNWQQIELGQATEGGLAVLSVHLQFLSKKNKQHIIDRIKSEHENNDSE